MSNEKAEVISVGRYDAETGQFVDFKFDCEKSVAAFEFLDDGTVLTGGYTTQELHAMIEEQKRNEQ